MAIVRDGPFDRLGEGCAQGRAQSTVRFAGEQHPHVGRRGVRGFQALAQCVELVVCQRALRLVVFRLIQCAAALEDEREICADGRQRIVEVMRDLRRQLTHALDPFLVEESALGFDHGVACLQTRCFALIEAQGQPRVLGAQGASGCVRGAGLRVLASQLAQGVQAVQACGGQAQERRGRAQDGLHEWRQAASGCADEHQPAGCAACHGNGEEQSLAARSTARESARCGGAHGCCLPGGQCQR